MRSLFQPAMLVALVALQSVSAVQTTAAANKAVYDALFLAQNFSGPVAARVGTHTNIVYKKTFGKLDWQFDIPMPQDARFPVGSNTKLHVAISMYQLQEAGKVNLSHNVADYLDANDFSNFGIDNQSSYCPHLAATPTVCEDQTFVQLMAMTGAVTDNSPLLFLPYPGSIGLVVGRYIQAPLLFKPGERYYYSNPSWIFLAYFIQKFSGMEFGAYLKQRIWEPVGLSNATYYNPHDEMFTYDPKRISEYHRYIDPNTKESVSIGKCTAEFQLGSVNGAGALISNQDDEAKLYFTVFNFTGNVGAGILSRASVYELVKARTPIAGVMYYGQGLFVNYEDPSLRLPQQIVYEGMIVCSWTANVYDLTKNPVTMGQAYTNTPVFYVSRKEVNSARSAQGSWFNLTAQWPQAARADDLAQRLIDLVASQNAQDGDRK